MDLPEGEHQYKFYVDGQWMHDPSEVSVCVCVEIEGRSEGGREDERE